MVDYGKKWSYFSFMGICGPNANDRGKCLISFVTVLFIVEEWLFLFTSLKVVSGTFSLVCFLSIKERTCENWGK